MQLRVLRVQHAPPKRRLAAACHGQAVATQQHHAAKDESVLRLTAEAELAPLRAAAVAAAKTPASAARTSLGRGVRRRRSSPSGAAAALAPAASLT